MLTEGDLSGLLENGASHAHGAWADGHHDPDEFARVASVKYGRVVPSTSVRRGYMRSLFGSLLQTETKMRGARPATWAEW